jgi:hypothetical protein
MKKQIRSFYDQGERLRKMNRTQREAYARKLKAKQRHLAEQAERVGLLKRTHDLPRDVGVRVVSGEITREDAVARRPARKAAKAARRDRRKASWKPNPTLGPWRSIADWLDHRWHQQERQRQPGDVYTKGRRLPGSYGSKQ